MELHDVHLLGRKPLGITTIPLHSIRHSNRVLKFVVYMVLVTLPSVLGMWSMALVLLWPFEYMWLLRVCYYLYRRMRANGCFCS